MTLAGVNDSVDDYLRAVPPRFRMLLGNLRRTIRAAAPDAEELISYRMPAFRLNGILVYYAAFNDHCSLFVASPRVRRDFAERLREFQGGKGTFQFTPEHPLPAALITEIVKARVAENLHRARGKPTRAPRARGNGAAPTSRKPRSESAGRVRSTAGRTVKR